MSQLKPFKLQIKPSTRTGTVIKLTISTLEEHVRNADGYKLSFDRPDNASPQIVVIQAVRNGTWVEINLPSIKQLSPHLYAELCKQQDHLTRFNATGDLYINVDDITEDIGNQYSQSLTDIIESNNIRLNESIFRAYYFPFFTLRPDEIADPDYNEKYLAAIRRWKIEVAGMSNDVDVVDPSGNVLFTVPSLSMRADINFVGETPIQAIHEELEFKNELNPAEGELYLEQELTKALKMEESAQRAGLNEAIQMINKIRLYYGRGPLFGETKVESAKVGQQGSSESEQFDDNDFVDM